MDRKKSTTLHKSTSYMRESDVCELMDGRTYKELYYDHRCAKAKARGANLKNKLIIMFVSFAVILSVILLVFNHSVTSYAADNGHEVLMSVDINCGDTLWSIAEENYTPKYGSINKYVRTIKKVNNFSDDKLYAGGMLIVPVYVYDE